MFSLPVSLYILLFPRYLRFFSPAGPSLSAALMFVCQCFQGGPKAQSFFYHSDILILIEIMMRRIANADPTEDEEVSSILLSASWFLFSLSSVAGELNAALLMRGYVDVNVCTMFHSFVDAFSFALCILSLLILVFVSCLAYFGPSGHSFLLAAMAWVQEAETQSVGDPAALAGPPQEQQPYHRSEGHSTYRRAHQCSWLTDFVQFHAFFDAVCLFCFGIMHNSLVRVWFSVERSRSCLILPLLRYVPAQQLPFSFHLCLCVRAISSLCFLFMLWIQLTDLLCNSSKNRHVKVFESSRLLTIRERKTEPNGSAIKIIEKKKWLASYNSSKARFIAYEEAWMKKRKWR